MKTIHQQLKEIDVEIFTHYSDLYVEVNEKTTKIIEGYEWKNNVTKFTSWKDGRLMFDIPLANDDYRKNT